MTYERDELVEYVRDVYAEVRNELKCWRYVMHQAAQQYERSETRIEDLLLELAVRVEDQEDVAGVEDPTASPPIPY